MIPNEFPQSKLKRFTRQEKTVRKLALRVVIGWCGDEVSGVMKVMLGRVETDMQNLSSAHWI
jgi:hypothetical protein